MSLKKDAVQTKSKRPGSSTIFYIGAIIVIIIGIAYLVTNIILFQKTVVQYTTQGYPIATVVNQLLPSQLLPGIYEPIGVYGGIALILFAVGIINHKISKCLSMMYNVEATESDFSSNDSYDSNAVNGLDPAINESESN